MTLKALKALKSLISCLLLDLHLLALAVEAVALDPTGSSFMSCGQLQCGQCCGMAFGRKGECDVAN